MNELRAHVENAVRPVRASRRKKLRMREEMLAHLLAVYDEEHARTGDEAEALERTLKRFGEPEDLAEELQIGLSLGERYEGWIDGIFLRRDGETELRHAVRLALLNIAWVLVLCVAPIVGLWLRSFGENGFEAQRRLHEVAAAGIGFTVGLGVNVVAFTLIGYRLREQFGQSLLRPRSWRRVAGLCAALAVSTLVGGWTFNVVVTRDFSESSRLMGSWVIAAAVAPFVTALLARSAAIEVQEERDLLAVIR